MIKLVTVVLFSLLLAGASSLNPAQIGDSWSEEEMGDPGDAQGEKLALRLLPEGEKVLANFSCDDKTSSCYFKLAYFLGDGFDLSKKQRRNILHIPGGPGAIVDSENRSATLRLLEKKHNVVYFHPRGMAQSAIDGSKEYDRFLRADYIVDDIEKLRQAILKSRPWDAIYAHSWGTVIAQRYTAKYGKSKVQSLILSGPVDRHRSGTHDARTRMTIANLKAIYDYYRSQNGAACRCQSMSFLKPLVTDFANPQISTFGGRLGANDNFCFLQAEVLEKIIAQFEKTIAEIEANYGSADSVVDNFRSLKKDHDFQARFGKYPVELFAAIRFIQMSGAPEKDALVFVADSRNRVNAALLIAHYLTAENPLRCSLKEELFKAAAPVCEYCERLRAARDELRALRGGRESKRGSYVYGVYDGVTRWMPGVIGATGCFYGKDMEKFAAQTGDDHRFIRDQVGKNRYRCRRTNLSLESGGLPP
jgi:pimeloyl-ACP methyl ester carboxylesterase